MTEIFGSDIYLPGTGEYVADGAARQAAWVALGSQNPPEWSGGEFQKIALAHSAPEVRERYLAAIAAI
jgi:xylulokinase